MLSASALPPSTNPAAAPANSATTTTRKRWRAPSTTTGIDAATYRPAPYGNNHPSSDSTSVMSTSTAVSASSIALSRFLSSPAARANSDPWSVDGIGAVAAPGEHPFGDRPAVLRPVGADPVGDRDTERDAPLGHAVDRTAGEVVDVAEPGDEVARGLAALSVVERDPVGLDARPVGTVVLDEDVAEEGHGRRVPRQHPPHPFEELVDAAREVPVHVGRAGVVAGADQLAVHPVDAAAVPHEHVAD